jgi:hypothetical protein
LTLCHVASLQSSGPRVFIQNINRRLRAIYW